MTEQLKTPSSPWADADVYNEFVQAEASGEIACADNVDGPALMALQSCYVQNCLTAEVVTVCAFQFCAA